MRLSIRSRLTVWVTLLLVAASALTFLTVRAAGGLVLRGTLRDYLIGMVEENARRIVWAESPRDARGILSIPCGSGYLEVDEDFLDQVSDVRAGLYSAEGFLLYGEDPLSRQMTPPAFEGTRLRTLEAAGERYILYDRALQPGPETVWLRGVVTETRSAAQLAQITRLSLLLLPLLTAAAALASWLLVDRMLRPLRRIEQTAGRISRGDDLGQRIDGGGRTDEAGRLAEAFNRMLDRLERSFETERQFTSDASHELRTPASVILAQCEYSLERPRSAGEYEEALRTVERQGLRMRDLIGAMLDCTRMEHADRWPMGEVDLSAVVTWAAALPPEGEARGITAETQIEDGITVRGNELLLERLVQNLVSNACRYGRDGGHVRVTLCREDGGAALTVADDGIGIAPEDRERIFERFYRADAARSVPGTGLGLAICDRIARLHGAAISVDSEPGRGSVFRVAFGEGEAKKEAES